MIASALVAGGACFLVNFLPVGTAVTSYQGIPLRTPLRNHPTRLALVADFRRGLQAEELVLHYQPKLDLRSCTIGSVEAWSAGSTRAWGCSGPARSWRWPSTPAW